MNVTVRASKNDNRFTVIIWTSSGRTFTKAFLYHLLGLQIDAEIRVCTPMFFVDIRTKGRVGNHTYNRIVVLDALYSNTRIPRVYVLEIQLNIRLKFRFCGYSRRQSWPRLTCLNLVMYWTAVDVVFCDNPRVFCWIVNTTNITWFFGSNHSKSAGVHRMVGIQIQTRTIFAYSFTLLHCICGGSDDNCFENNMIPPLFVCEQVHLTKSGIAKCVFNGYDIQRTMVQIHEKKTGITNSLDKKIPIGCLNIQRIKRIHVFGFSYRICPPN